MTLFIAPTEHRLVKLLPDAAISSLPERMGCDILWTDPSHGMVGCQRKEFNDLLASVADGRLSKELGQMNHVGLPVLILEGQPRWTLDGALADPYRSWTRTQHRGLIMSIQTKGVFVLQTEDLADTAEAIVDLRAWAAKTRHTSLDRRPKAAGTWGKASHKDWCKHLLQSFDGLGPVQAAAIYDHFNGLPMRWVVDEADLMRVPGIGKTKARRLVEALGG